jgi:ABC-type glycerol-3-phosphate transport system substrate-binding protein
MSKLPALILAAAIISTFFTACASSGTDTETTTAGQTVTTQAENTETTLLYPVLPEKNYDGYEFSFLVRDESAMIFAEKAIFSDGESGEPINDAVYRRNKKIEETFNIKITQNAVASPSATIKTLITAGDCPYDAMSEATQPVSLMARENMLVELYDVPYLDLSMPWWDQTLKTDLSIGGKLYLAAGDLIITDEGGTWGFIFNKNLAENRGIEDLYAAVKNGSWTLDKFAGISKSVSEDLNGDGKFNVKDDLYGFATESYNTFVFMVGSDTKLCGKDADDYPVLMINNDKFITAYDKAVAISKAESSLHSARITGVSGNVFYEGIIPAFNDGRILFYLGSMALVPLFRDMENEFGILPVPKYDEDQENYMTTMSVYNNGSISIPITNADLERTGIILEALAAESSYTLMPAYYEITLKTKLSRDNESADMLDILFAHRRIDPCSTYNFGGMFDLISSETTDLVSGYMSREEKALAEIQKLIEG